MENLTIRDWSIDDRPREKLKLKGRKSLSDAELLAIILGSGTKRKSAVDLAKELLANSAYSFNQLNELKYNDLIKFKGIGEAKAITILAAMEIASRNKLIEKQKKIKIQQAKDVYNYIYNDLVGINHEEAFGIFLNRSNEIIHKEQLSKGGRSGTIIDGKIVFQIALNHAASSIILVHNHPSGNLNPSVQDVSLTEKLCAYGKMIELPIIDHLIFTDYGYFSFSESGKIS
jgi:DNA repair protein RadC